jgi:hypothetical protein
MSKPFPKPCLDCGGLTTLGSRCEKHQAERDATRAALAPQRKYKNKPRREHYMGDYKARAKAVRESAVYCHLCGDSARALDPWTADHLIAGDPLSPLLPAHRSCNSRRKNKPLT